MQNSIIIHLSPQPPRTPKLAPLQHGGASALQRVMERVEAWARRCGVQDVLQSHLFVSFSDVLCRAPCRMTLAFLLRCTAVNNTQLPHLLTEKKLASATLPPQPSMSYRSVHAVSLATMHFDACPDAPYVAETFMLQQVERCLK